MGRSRVIHLTSLGALRRAASAWDELWWRSEGANPVVRAELVAQWVERFAPGRRFGAVVVEERGCWVAALPLVQRGALGALGVAGLPGNAWSRSGDLLIDPDCDVPAVLKRLAGALRQTGWRLLWLDGVPLASPRWRAFLEATQCLGMAVDCRVHYQAGLIRLCHDQQQFLATLPKKHRTKMARSLRRIAERGPVRLEFLSPSDPEEVEPLLRRAFEIEDRSWKGQGGTSVLRTPGMFEYYVGQARQLARWGHLELAFLWCGEWPASFVYGAAAKGISFWDKIGYDPALRCCTPGQLLQGLVLERLQEDPLRCAVDTMGPVTSALAQWQPDLYPVGRAAVDVDGKIGRVAILACRHAAPWLRWLRGRCATAKGPQVGASTAESSATPPARQPIAADS